MKKALAVSILSMGVLSSAPSALCVGNEKLEYCFATIVAQYMNNKENIGKLASINKEYGSVISTIRKNPTVISSLKDVRRLLPSIETFEDYHQLTEDENRNNHVNEFEERIKTLIYYPGSFDAQRFHDILRINGKIENDLRCDAAQIKVIKDYNFKQVPALCGKEWARIIYPFNGMYYRVEYIKGYNTKYLDDPSRRRIVFLFSPVHILNDNEEGLFDEENAFSSFNRFMDEDYGFGGLVNINENDINGDDGKEGKRKFMLPTHIDKIGKNAFFECDTLEEIEIPNSVKSIGKYAFYNCTSLKEVNLSDNIKKISNSAFKYCTALGEINIPDKVKVIGKYAFAGCTNLKKVKMPNKIESIDDFVFEDCQSLENVELQEGIEKIGSDVFSGCTSLKKINIPNSVKEIGTFAFADCTSLKEINLPNSIELICYKTFNNCTSLEKVGIPNSVKIIKSNAFVGCTSLKEITIPNSVQKIGRGAFEGCTSLEKVDIPNSVKKINSNAFNGCNSLKIRWNEKVYDTVAEFFADFNKK